MSSMRHVQVGGRWEPPPAAGGLDPDTCGSVGEWRDLLCQLAAAAPADRQPTLQQAAVRGFRGVSPQLVRDLCQLAGVAPDAAPDAVSTEQWDALWAQWQAWQACLASGDYAPTACPDSGAYSLVGSQPAAVPALLPFLRAYYSAEQRVELYDGARQQLAKAVAAATARLQKKVESLRRQGGQGDKHEGTRKQADMLMANVHR